MQPNLQEQPVKTLSQNHPPELLCPVLDLRAQFETTRHEVMAAISRVMESQHVILERGRSASRPVLS